DGHNDTYYPVFFTPQAVVRDFRIYNRWGSLIYDNPNVPGWNGTYKGEEQPTEAYVYFVHIQTPDPNNPTSTLDIKKNGSFTLLR
ncbi:MAG TPA: T9SS type B sorting domain-containing protein, partial [Chitinophagales bacterium]